MLTIFGNGTDAMVVEQLGPTTKWPWFEVHQYSSMRVIETMANITVTVIQHKLDAILEKDVARQVKTNTSLYMANLLIVLGLDSTSIN